MGEIIIFIIIIHKGSPDCVLTILSCGLMERAAVGYTVKCSINVRGIKLKHP